MTNKIDPMEALRFAHVNTSEIGGPRATGGGSIALSERVHGVPVAPNIPTEAKAKDECGTGWARVTPQSRRKRGDGKSPDSVSQTSRYPRPRLSEI